MTPAPTLQELIETVERDAPSRSLLDLLTTASSTVTQLEEVADAVLGHFVDRCRRHGHSWSEISTALGVSKQAAHKRFSLPGPTLERFTPRARGALDAAAKAARSLGHNYVGTEHLLLGLFAEPEGLAARALAERGVDRAVVEAKVLEVIPRRAEPLLENPPYLHRHRAHPAGAAAGPRHPCRPPAGRARCEPGGDAGPPPGDDHRVGPAAGEGRRTLKKYSLRPGTRRFFQRPPSAGGPSSSARDRRGRPRPAPCGWRPRRSGAGGSCCPSAARRSPGPSAC